MQEPIPQNTSPKKETFLTVTQPAELLKFLLEQMPGKSRNAVKSLLTHKLVSIDGKAITQYNYPLQPGQKVAIGSGKAADTVVFRELRIVFEDKHIIVIEKQAGLLSVATDGGIEQTAHSLLNEHVRKTDARNKIFIVHRLDRETSGLMLFAKSLEVQEKLQHNWQETVSERNYIALVEGEVKKEEGIVISWLRENKAFVVFSSPTPNNGQKAITNYKVLRKNEDFSLVELHLETGRKNQIRVHMQDIGHPIVGDKKYGANGSPISRLGLHAFKLAFRHPVTNEEMSFETPVPRKFASVF